MSVNSWGAPNEWVASGGAGLVWSINNGGTGYFPITPFSPAGDFKVTFWATIDVNEAVTKPILGGLGGGASSDGNFVVYKRDGAVKIQIPLTVGGSSYLSVLGQLGVKNQFSLELVGTTYTLVNLTTGVTTAINDDYKQPNINYINRWSSTIGDSVLSDSIVFESTSDNRNYDLNLSNHDEIGNQPVLTETIGGDDATGVNFPTSGVWIYLGGGGLTTLITNHQTTIDLLATTETNHQSLITLLNAVSTDFTINSDLFGQVVLDFQNVIDLLEQRETDYQVNLDLLSQNTVVTPFTILLDLREQVTKSYNAQINLLGQIINDHQSVVNLLSRGVTEYSPNFDMFQLVNKSYQVNLDLLSQGTVITPFTVLLDLREQVTKTFSQDLEFLEQVTLDNKIVATLLNAVTMDFIDVFSLNEQVVTDYVISLDYIGRVNSVYDVVFNIESDLTPKTPMHYVITISGNITFSDSTTQISFVESTSNNLII